MKAAKTNSILIFGATDDCDNLERLPLDRYDAVVLAFWSSPEFVRRLKQAGARTCWPLKKLTDHYPTLVKRQYALAQHYVTRVPSYRGINPLLGWEGSIANALMTPLVAFKLYQALLTEWGAGTEVTFLSANDFQAAFAQINMRFGSPFKLSLRKTGRNERRGPGHRLAAFWQLLQEAWWDGDMAQLVWTPFHVLDGRYRVRKRLWPAVTVRPGGTWCYSSYVNYTRILACHAAYMSEQPRWVVNNYSACKGLPQGADWHYIWQFRPIHRRQEEHRRVLEAAWASLQEVPEEVNGLPLRSLLSQNTTISSLLFRYLPQFLAEIDLMDAFLEQAQPEQLWVANQWGSEGLLVQLARDRGIPVIQVQHGSLEQYYAYAPVYSDRFLVWGDFWKQAVNPAAQDRVQVVNPGFEVVPTERRAHNRSTRVVFFTAPPDLLPFWNPSVVLWEVITLLNRLVAAGHSVTVQVHPMDRINTWRTAWIKYAGTLPASVRFDKGGSLEPVLRETDVAIMFFSTVFLNCIASGIPVVSLGWYPFMWREALEREGLIHFADSLDEAWELVLGLSSQSPSISNISRVLAPSSVRFIPL